MAKLGKLYRNHSISHATLKTEDLMERFVDFLQGEVGFLGTDQVKKLTDIMYDWKCIYEHAGIDYDEETMNTKLAELLNDDVFDLMDDIAPKGCYFGAHEGHEGDGSDFGFWEDRDSDDRNTVVLRRFNEKDWQNWMGCDGENPKIGEIYVDDFECEIVADKNGIGILGYLSENDNFHELSATMICSSQEVSEEIVEGLSKRVSWSCLESIGFFKQ